MARRTAHVVHCELISPRTIAVAIRKIATGLAATILIDVRAIGALLGELALICERVQLIVSLAADAEALVIRSFAVGRSNIAGFSTCRWLTIGTQFSIVDQTVSVLVLPKAFVAFLALLIEIIVVVTVDHMTADWIRVAGLLLLLGA